MTDGPRHSVSVAAAIFDEAGENVLLIKRRDNGNWEPPGGVLELDETIEDGLRREVREETGAEIEVGQLTGVYKNMNHGIIALVFRCALASQHGSDSDEASQIAWRSIENLSGCVAGAYAIRILDAAASSVAIRSHDGVQVLRDSSSPRPNETRGSDATH